MNFKNWLRKNHFEDGTWECCLAHDIRADEKFPSNGVGKFEGWHALMRKYLEENRACSECWMLSRRAGRNMSNAREPD